MSGTFNDPVKTSDHDFIFTFLPNYEIFFDCVHNPDIYIYIHTHKQRMDREKKFRATIRLQLKRWNV
jgi:hypothetical protein